MERHRKCIVLTFIGSRFLPPSEVESVGRALLLFERSFECSEQRCKWPDPCLRTTMCRSANAPRGMHTAPLSAPMAFTHVPVRLLRAGESGRVAEAYSVLRNLSVCISRQICRLRSSRGRRSGIRSANDEWPRSTRERAECEKCRGAKHAPRKTTSGARLMRPAQDGKHFVARDAHVSDPRRPADKHVNSSALKCTWKYRVGMDSLARGGVINLTQAPDARAIVLIYRIITG